MGWRSKGGAWTFDNFEQLGGIVPRLARLARSIRDLLNTLATITGRGCLPLPRRRMGRHHHAPRSIDADSPGGLAEFVRDLIRTRTEGAGTAPRRER